MPHSGLHEMISQGVLRTVSTIASRAVDKRLNRTQYTFFKLFSCSVFELHVDHKYGVRAVAVGRVGDAHSEENVVTIAIGPCCT